MGETHMSDTPPPIEAIFDGPAVVETWNKWRRLNDVSEGDVLEVSTPSRDWATPMEVTEVRHDEVRFETAAGNELAIVTYSSDGATEPDKPMVRLMEGFESEGVIDRVRLRREQDGDTQ